jgi:hypothetical protein
VAHKKREALTARIVFEVDAVDHDRMRKWVIQRIKNSCNSSQLGMVSIRVYNDAGELEGLTTVGQVSEETEAMLDEVFEIRRPENGAA